MPFAPLNATSATDEVEVGSGDTLILNYDIEVLKGDIYLQIQGADGVVFQKHVTVSETSSTPIPINHGGTYQLVVDTENQFDGAYSWTWDQVRDSTSDLRSFVLSR